MSRHSPTPWRRGYGGEAIYDANGWVVARIEPQYKGAYGVPEDRLPEREKANGTLIAEAPNLHRALGEAMGSNSCMCLYGIGHPQVEEHSKRCLEARALLGRLEGLL